jgi:hypothetical protein
MRFVHVPEKAKRPRIEEVEDVLISALGKKYIWGIVLQKVVSGDDAQRIIDVILETPNALERTIDDINRLLDESKDMIGEKKTSVRMRAVDV